MINAEEKIELLGKIMKDETAEKTKLEKVYERLYKEINKSFAEVLESSIIPNKASILAELNRIQETVELLVYYPDLLGKTAIGVVGSDERTFSYILDKLVERETLKTIRMNTNIPCICFNSDKKGITAFNVLESEVNLNDKDFNNVTRQLYKNRIDIRNMIDCFSVRGEIKLKKCNLIHFPDHVYKMKDFKIALEDKVHVFVMAVSSDNNKSHINFIHAKNNTKKPIIVICEENELDWFNNKFGELRSNIKLICASQLEIILDGLCLPRENYKFIDEVRLCLSRVHKFYNIHLNKYRSRLETINADLVNIDQNDTEEIVKDIRNSLIKVIDNSKQSYNKINDHIENLIRTCSELESIFEEYIINTSECINTMICDEDLLEVWCELALVMMEIGDYTNAKTYISKLSDNGYKYAYILDLLLSNYKGEFLSQSQLSRLKDEEGKDQLIYKSKVELSNKLGLDINAITAAASRIYEPEKPSEFYYKALGMEKNNVEKAIEYYFEALELGDINSGNRLFQMANNYNIVSLDKLAQNMVPDANYKLGMSIIDSQYAKGLTNLKMAAAYGHLPAIKYLADDMFKKIRNDYYKNISDNDLELKYENVFNLYKYILNQEPNNQMATEKIGLLYYKLEDFRRALEFLTKCNTAEALYHCGRIYQYGNGTVQDLPKAKEYFEKSSKLGCSRAECEYNKVIEWIRNNDLKAAQKSSSYRSTASYSSSSSSRSYSSSSSDKGCFITTATCSALNKEDNCDELLVIKKYRDVMKTSDPKVKELIKEYYRVAPSIVIEIDNEIDSQNIYLSLWDEYIKKTYDYIVKNDYSAATKTYIRMVEGLCRRYNVELTKEAEDAVVYLLS